MKRATICVTFAILVHVALAFKRSSRYNLNNPSNIQDPRKNASFYDLVVSENCEYDAKIGQVDEILTVKKLKNYSKISKYKLIYYSPQLIPSVVLTHDDRNEHEPIFSIDSLTGHIFIKTPSSEPTLEYLCLKHKYCSCFSCIFSLNIIFTTANNKVNAETVRVFIDDHNDYAPTFVNANLTLIQVNISEASQIGDSFKLEQTDYEVIDQDAFYNQITYYLSDEIDLNTNQRSNYFEVVSNQKNELSLVLKTHLDYEKQQRFYLYLIAQDNGGLKSSKKLQINVLDENDNSPVCEKSLFIASIKENLLSRDVVQIRAFDLDSGMNAKLQYSILPNDKLDNTLFQIDKHSGSISVINHLDFEKKTSHDLVIKVNDSNINVSFTTYCSCRINVLDVNDNRAQVRVIKFLNESVQRSYYSLNQASETENQIEIFENNSNQPVLSLLRVFDKDTLSNYKFQIKSVTNSPEDLNVFNIRVSDRSNREFELVSLKPLDSETIQNYRLKIILYDLEENFDNQTYVIDFKPQLNEVNFSYDLFESIKVLDLNDNKPAFAKKLYEFSIQENVVNVSLNDLGSIQAFDIDTSELNCQIKYKIANNNSNGLDITRYLFVNASNFNYPILFINESFDYEQIGDSLEFSLIAYNDLDNYTDFARIIVKIEDQNDNTPIFLNKNFSFSIRENLPIDTFIGRIDARDNDKSPFNNLISFRILNQHFASLFKIDTLGSITSQIVFNREIQSYYSLKVEAYDNGKPTLSSQAIFHITIEDENDNVPEFVFPSEKTRFMNMKLNSSNIGTKINLFDIKATDNDLGENGRLSYQINSTNSILSVNSANGTVYLDSSKLNSSLDDFKQVIQVNLTCSDNGEQLKLAKTINFTFYLNYQVDEIPFEILRQIEKDDSQVNNEIYLYRTKSNDSLINDSTNDLQKISNGVLIIILLVILFFMLLIACFIFFTIYRIFIQKRVIKKSSSTFKSNSTSSNAYINSTSSSVTNGTTPPPLILQRFKCIDQVKSYLRTRICSPNRLSSLRNLTTSPRNSLCRFEQNNLKVKDAPENSNNPTYIEPILLKNSNYLPPTNLNRTCSQPSQTKDNDVYNEAITKLNNFSKEAKQLTSGSIVGTLLTNNRLNKIGYLDNQEEGSKQLNIPEASIVTSAVNNDSYVYKIRKAASNANYIQKNYFLNNQMPKQLPEDFNEKINSNKLKQMLKPSISLFTNNDKFSSLSVYDDENCFNKNNNSNISNDNSQKIAELNAKMLKLT